MIKVKWLGVNDRPDDLPLTRGYEDDAGLDLRASEEVVIPSGQFRDVPSGIAVQLPEETWAMIFGRSSSIRRRGVSVYPGIIDPGWRGELFAGCLNLGSQVAIIRPGERIAQLLLFTNETRHHEVVWCDELVPTARGLAGFGSTGR